MKKLLTIGIAAIIITVSCKKQEVTPIVAKLTQITTSVRCQDSGICSEGIYQSRPTAQAGGQYDTVIHATNSTQLGTVKLVFVKFTHVGSTAFDGSDTVLYKIIPIDFNANVLDTNWLYKNTSINFQYTFITFKTKHGSWCIFDYKQPL